MLLYICNYNCVSKGILFELEVLVVVRVYIYIYIGLFYLLKLCC